MRPRRNPAPEDQASANGVGMPGDISAGATRASETRARAILIAMLAAVTSLSQFFRASGGVIAPELIRDLGLSPELLGLASGAFFIALGVAQIPVGMMFDRIGARRTVAA